MELEQLPPEDIERRSFEIIEEELKAPLDPALAPIIKRVIHATADFDFAEALCFSKSAVAGGLEALQNREIIVTDTNMARAGINREALGALGVQVLCFMADADVAQESQRRKITRAAAAMDKAARLPGHPIFVVGNAPTALVRLAQLIRSEAVTPSLVVGVPVGFVNVVQSKERIMEAGAPYIVTKGRKGGSTVAAAIVNALMYRLARPE